MSCCSILKISKFLCASPTILIFDFYIDTEFLVSEDVANYQNVLHVLDFRLDSCVFEHSTKLRGFDAIRNYFATCVFDFIVATYTLFIDVQHPISGLFEADQL